MRPDDQNAQQLADQFEKPRGGWEQSFSEMARLGDDRLIDEASHPLTVWDYKEWEW
jgi:hypothetical protein